MSKHREAYSAFQTMANYCCGRACDDCIFYKEKAKNCCYLSGICITPYGIMNSNGETIKKRIAELEQGEEL